MDLNELQSVRDRERQTDKLQQLRTSFYADAGEFIQQLRDHRDRAAERADDPFDAPEVSRLSDEIDTAEQTVEAIYEKRVGKIVKAASFAAADLPADVDGMTAEETELFDSLVEDIKKNRQHVLDVLAGDTDDGTPDEASDQSTGHESPVENEGKRATTPRISDGTPPDSEVAAADLMGEDDEQTADDSPSEPADKAPTEAVDEHTDEDASSEPAEENTQPDEPSPPVRNDGGTAAVDRATVRITDDVGAILGIDQREYDLSEHDVVTLPSANAEPLLNRDAATRLD